MLRRALFLDRDGTIIHDRGYARDPETVELLPGAGTALRHLADAGWTFIVISNQSGVGRGIITPEEMDAVQNRFLALLAEHGVEIAASYLCVHAPEEACDCRKPSPGCLLRAADEHGLDIGVSWMVGDREGDILCGKSAGCSTIWICNDEHPVDPALPDHSAADWNDILRLLGES